MRFGILGLKPPPAGYPRLLSLPTNFCPFRNQSYLQLLCSLQNKLVISEGKAEDKEVKGRKALPPKSKSP